EAAIRKSTTSIIVERGDCAAIKIARRKFRLIALRVGAVFKRALHVPALPAAIETGELAVDEARNIRLARARPVLVARNQAGDDCIDAARLIAGEEARRFKTARRIGLPRQPRNFALNGSRQRPGPGERRT